MSFFYLLLGHFFGDFLLQTNKIAEKKAAHSEWNLIHALIVTISMLVFAVPFGWLCMVLVLLSGGMHFCIDSLKLKAVRSFPIPPLFYFVLDQSLHILIIFGISQCVSSTTVYLPVSNMMIRLLLVLVYVSSFAAVLSQYVVGFISPRANKKFFEEDERSMGNITRLFTAFGLYLSYLYSPLFLLVVITAFSLFIYQFKKKWRSWMSIDHFIVKFTIDFMIAYTGFVFLLL